MSLDGHIAELRQRHQKLDARISEALMHPSTDNLALRHLKREKLKIKEEIERLRSD